MSGAILTADGAETVLAIGNTPNTPTGATFTDKASTSLTGGGAAVLRQWATASAKGLVLDLYDATGALTASADVGQDASLLATSLIPLAGGGVAAAYTGQTGAAQHTSY